MSDLEKDNREDHRGAPGRGHNGHPHRALGFACVRRSLKMLCKQAVPANLSEQARTFAAFAMQKVEGSSPFIRFFESPVERGFPPL